MPTQKIVTLYTLDELPTDAAKEKARDWFRQTDEPDTESTFEDFTAVCAALGVTIATDYRQKNPAPKIFYSGFWSQGDGASFAGSLAVTGKAGEAIREYAPQDSELHRIADTLDKMAARFPKLTADIVTGRYGGNYSHSGMMSVDIDPGDENSMDWPGLEDQVQTLMRNLADWLYKSLETDYEANNAAEVVDDNIRANEYTFREDGTRED